METLEPFSLPKSIATTAASGSDPFLVPILALRPTQITVGLREVVAKLKRRQLSNPEPARPLPIVPVILGPGRQPYLRDRHHLTLAQHFAGFDAVRVAHVDDLSHLETGAFWSVLADRNWVHPFDRNGHRQSFEKIPASVVDLEDDPFRSLAGELRRAGGFQKSPVPYAEFAWANFLRARIARTLLDEDFDAAVQSALTLAWSVESRDLPGWRGKADVVPAMHRAEDALLSQTV